MNYIKMKKFPAGLLEHTWIKWMLNNQAFDKLPEMRSRKLFDAGVLEQGRIRLTHLTCLIMSFRIITEDASPPGGAQCS